MYTLTVEGNFSSAHQLRGYRGKCENLHGHNWKVVLSVRGEELDSTGLLIDFTELKSMLRDIIEELDHRNINDIPCFTQQNPSSENIARYIAEQFASSLRARGHAKISMDSVTVWESDTSRCTFTF
jgi:6-pyruvoyltetrahydropterin/6-carboxytetrahydropterin synthase